MKRSIRKILWSTLILHFNIGKSKLSSLPMAIRLVRLVELIAFALMGTESKRRQYEARTISIVFPRAPNERVATKITECSDGYVSLCNHVACKTTSATITVG